MNPEHADPTHTETSLPDLIVFGCAGRWSELGEASASAHHVHCILSPLQHRMKTPSYAFLCKTHCARDHFKCNFETRSSMCVRPVVLRATGPWCRTIPTMQSSEAQHQIVRITDKIDLEIILPLCMGLWEYAAAQASR